MYEALQITYGQYVAVELADKLYNSVTVVFCTAYFCFSKVANGFELRLEAHISTLIIDVWSNHCAIRTKLILIHTYLAKIAS